MLRPFARLPAIPPLNIAPVEQAPASLPSGSTVSDSSFKYDERGLGCLVKGNVDIAQDWAPFIASPLRKTKRDYDNKVIAQFLIHAIRAIPSNRVLLFNLEDSSNMTWLSPFLHRHHAVYGTVIISPCLHDLRELTRVYRSDNARRQYVVDANFKAPGRSTPEMLFPKVDLINKFELVALHPSHFLIDGEPMSARVDDENGIGQVKLFYNSRRDGLLRDLANNLFPPFAPRYPRSVALNPLLVNIAAAIRVRRFKRLNQGALPLYFHQHALDIMDAVLDLHDALFFRPQQKPREKANIPESDPSNNVWQRLRHGNVDADDLDVIFGGYDFEDLPDLDIGGASRDSSPQPPTPDMPLNEKMQMWMTGSSNMQGSFV